MTRQRFCASRGMTLSASDYYLRRYGKPRPARDAPRLAPVAMTPAEPALRGSFRLGHAKGRSIECGATELEHLYGLVRDQHRKSGPNPSLSLSLSATASYLKTTVDFAQYDWTAKEGPAPLATSAILRHSPPADAPNRVEWEQKVRETEWPEFSPF